MTAADFTLETASDDNLLALRCCDEASAILRVTAGFLEHADLGDVKDTDLEWTLRGVLRLLDEVVEQTSSVGEYLEHLAKPTAEPVPLVANKVVRRRKAGAK